MKRLIFLWIFSIQPLPASPPETPYQLDLEWRAWYAALEHMWNTTLHNVTFDARSLPQDSVKLLESAAGLASGPLQRFAGYSLIVRRPEIVDNADFQPSEGGSNQPPGPWTFPSLMTRAFRILGQPSGARVENYFHAWAENSDPLNVRWIAASSARPLSAIPLRLLAVVNRLDQGKLIDCPDRKVCGAEFRFVYGGITIPKDTPTKDPTLKNAIDPYFTVSVEFVLPPLSRDDFAGFTRSWASLAVPAINTHPVADLERVLDSIFTRWSQPEARVVRIRTTLRLGGSWQMRQYSVDAAHGLTSVALDQETSVNVGKCVVKDSPLGDFAAHNSTAIFDATFTTPRVLATRAATLSEHNNTVMTLEGGIVPPPQLDKLRFSLSLDACRGCHGMETRGELRPAKPQGGFRQFTQFDQIKYREKGHSSQLSPFLAGKFSDPSFIPWPVKPPTVIACPGAPSPQARNYDDLLRRFLFHLAVLIVPQDDWDATFRRMQLTAFQTH